MNLSNPKTTSLTPGLFTSEPSCDFMKTCPHLCSPIWGEVFRVTFLHSYFCTFLSFTFSRLSQRASLLKSFSFGELLFWIQHRCCPLCSIQYRFEFTIKNTYGFKLWHWISFRALRDSADSTVNSEALWRALLRFIIKYGVVD